MADEQKKRQQLIYFMQKECSHDSWVDFLHDTCGMSLEEADDFFSEIAEKLGLDVDQFYF